ncbi:MAG: NAD(+) synthase [Lentisphaerae bacterium]|nr:NAD(+) synthase [Lentisphaerota bacterium]
MLNMIRIAAAVPELRCADVHFNAEQLEKTYRSLCEKGVSLAVFPAFAVTGKSCGVLFEQPYFLEEAQSAAEKFAAVTGAVPAVFGAVRVIGGVFAGGIAVAQHGKITGFVVRDHALTVEPGVYPAGTVFDAGVRFAVNFAGDLPAVPAAQLQIFCGAEAEIPGAWSARKKFGESVSSTTGCVAVQAFSGSDESTGDQVYGGALHIAAAGKSVAARPSPARGAGEIIADIDLDPVIAGQLKKSFVPVRAVMLDKLPQSRDLSYFHNPAHPFLPEDPAELADFCRESFALQTIGLGERFMRCGAKKMVLGISGGLDSTLALAALAMVCKEYALPPDTILAVTMPGFGTTGRTKNNAVKLAEVLGAEIREISIVHACSQHFADIGHDPAVTNSVYENSQARERTQILMDIANEVNGIVIGTGDLSEIALGWSTFNGDQMAMYAVNCSIPKSNIAAMLEYAAGILPGTAEILQDVIDTPVSPELLPLDENGEIAQKTEAILGAYELHDYYLWHLVHGTSDPEKLFQLAKHAFAGKYPDAELLRVCDLFMKRFFTQQFKRTAAPDGVQAGVVSLSARTAWQMPADISGKLWRK